VVAKDVAPYTVVAGNPAQPIKRRFEEDTINSLLEIRWWDWPVEKIEANIDAIVGGDVELLKRAEG
jgi:virginiamycin A acetyltransferase